MTRIFALSTIVALLSTAGSNPAYAQGAGAGTASIRAVAGIPTGSLGDIFKPSIGGGVTVGFMTDSDMMWEAVFEYRKFSRPNGDRLHWKNWAADSLKLEMVGAGVQGTYFLFGQQGLFDATVHPFVSGSASVYRWHYLRGPHATDSSGTVIAPFFEQRDWSIGVRAGLGCEITPIEGVAFVVQASYGIVIGEIWPALSLRMENVSGMQIADAVVGIRVYW